MHDSGDLGPLLQDADAISEFDLEFINALQIDPRASWNRLATILGVAPSTLSRRWQTLTSAGLAWVTTSPGLRHLDVGSTAFVFLSVEPGRIPAVLKSLEMQAEFATVSQIAGTHDLLVDCLAPSAQELTKLLTRSSQIADGINNREVMVSTRVYRGATGWRAGALEPEKARQVLQPSTRHGQLTFGDPIDSRIVSELGNDGRMSWAELGQRCGVAPATARRRTEVLLAAGAFSLRCDAATPIRQGRHGITLLLDVPATHLEELGFWFAERNDCRLCAEVVGQGNLLVTLWFREFSDLQVCERGLLGVAPGTRVISRHLELGTTKRLGMLLDEQGRRYDRVSARLV